MDKKDVIFKTDKDGYWLVEFSVSVLIEGKRKRGRVTIPAETLQKIVRQYETDHATW